MHLMHRSALAVICVAATVACAACGSTKASRYYLLDAGAPLESKQSDRAPRTIQVGPVTIPGYLDRQQMVSRVPTNSLRLAQYDRWAEPLKEGVPRVLASNLAALLPGDRVLPYPATAIGTFHYRVHVDIQRLDGVPGGQADLIADWTIRGADGSVAIRRPQQRLTVSVAEASYDALARAESELLLQLSRQIAADLTQTPGSTTP